VVRKVASSALLAEHSLKHDHGTDA